MIQTSKKIPQMRSGFIGLMMLVAAIIGIGVIAGVATPSLHSYWDRQKVDRLIEKEKNIRDIMRGYAGLQDSGMTGGTIPQNIDDLYTRACNDKIIPYSASSAADKAEFVSNGFGGTISLSLESNSILKIESAIPAAKSYARSYYASSLAASFSPAYVGSGDIVGHRYFLGGAYSTYIQNTSVVNENAIANGATTDAATAQSTGQTYWNYDPISDTVRFQTWNSSTGSWTTTRTIDNASLSTSGDLSAATSGGGGNISLVGSTDSTSTNYIAAGSVADGTMLISDNGDGTASTFVAIGGAWLQATSGASSSDYNGTGFYPPTITDRPDVVHGGDTITVSAGSDYESVVQKYVWSAEGAQILSYSTEGKNRTATMKITARVGELVNVNVYAISTQGVMSSMATNSWYTSIPIPEIDGQKIVYDTQVRQYSVTNAWHYVNPVYSWSVLEGPATLTSGGTTDKATFTFGSGTAPVKIRCTIQDNGGTTYSDYNMSAFDTPQAPALVISGDQFTAGDSNLSIDADSGDGQLSGSNNTVDDIATGWEVEVEKHDGTKVVYNSNYFTISSSTLDETFIGTVKVRSRFTVDDGTTWSHWSDQKVIYIKPKPVLITNLPSPMVMYFGETLSEFTIDRQGVNTGYVIDWTATSGSLTSTTGDATTYSAPASGNDGDIGMVSVTITKNGQTSVPTEATFSFSSFKTPRFEYAHFTKFVMFDPDDGTATSDLTIGDDGENVNADLTGGTMFYYADVNDQNFSANKIEQIAARRISDGRGSDTYIWSIVNGTASVGLSQLTSTVSAATVSTTDFNASRALIDATCQTYGSFVLSVKAQSRGLESPTVAIPLECGKPVTVSADN